MSRDFDVGNHVEIYGRRGCVGRVVAREAFLIVLELPDGERRTYDVDELRTWAIGRDLGPRPDHAADLREMQVQDGPHPAYDPSLPSLRLDPSGFHEPRGYAPAPEARTRSIDLTPSNLQERT